GESHHTPFGLMRTVRFKVNQVGVDRDVAFFAVEHFSGVLATVVGVNDADDVEPLAAADKTVGCLRADGGELPASNDNCIVVHDEKKNGNTANITSFTRQ